MMRFVCLFLIILSVLISACSTEPTRPTSHLDKAPYQASLQSDRVKVWIQKYSDSARYEGELKNGKRHGRGIYIYPNGSRYTGEWQYGKKHGWGIYKWPSGNQYEGEWANGNRHGKGTLVFADGGIYRGIWIHGKTGSDVSDRNFQRKFTPTPTTTSSYQLKDTSIPKPPERKRCSDLTPPKLACSRNNREEKAFAMCAIKAGGCYAVIRAYGDELGGLGRIASGPACEALVAEISGEEYQIENLLQDVALGVADEMADSALEMEGNDFFTFLTKAVAVGVKLYLGASMLGKFESCMAEAEMECSEIYDNWKKQQNCY